MSLSINEFETTTVNEWGEAFGLIDLEPDTTAYRRTIGELLFTVGFNGEEWVCEIDDISDEGFGCVTCWQGDSPQVALEAAAIDAEVTAAFNENDNCEDAVNYMAYEAYMLLNGGSYPYEGDDIRQLNRLLGHAVPRVMKDGPRHGIEWFEYRF